MNKLLRGEVWLVDLGMAAKVRPCVVLSVSPAEEERDLYTLIAHTPAREEHVSKLLRLRNFCGLEHLMPKTW